MGVWIDTDMGVDDLFAILMTTRHARIDGISLSFGNAPLEQVKRNAAGARAVFGLTQSIYSGADRAILGGVETAQNVLGAGGMPSRGASLPEASPGFASLSGALAAWLETQSVARILALGPLTNLAVLALSRPDLLSRIGDVVWMGGGLTQGNHTASAEFNAFADPEALAILLSRHVPLTMVDLDACRQVQITEANVANLRSSRLLKDLMGGYLDIALSRGRNSMALYDPVAAAAFLRPDLFEFAPARVEVELCGQHTRGRTIVDPRDQNPANATIVRSVNATSVLNLCLDALEHFRD